MAKRNTRLIGAAGEYFVMYRLLMKDKVAALAPPNADTVDILVSDRMGGNLASVQVKTKGSPVTIGWDMNVKHEGIENERLFYCFVDPCENDQPKCWIIPSAVVAEHVKSTHRAWLTDPNAKAGSRNDGDRRKLHVHTKNPAIAEYQRGWLDQYEEAWHLLD